MTHANSMREFLKYEPSAIVLDYVAKTKHTVLSIIRDKHAILLIPVSEYIGLEYDPTSNAVTVSYKNHEQIETITVDFNEENSDIIGFPDMNSAFAPISLSSTVSSMQSTIDNLNSKITSLEALVGKLSQQGAASSGSGEQAEESSSSLRSDNQ